MSIKHIKNLGFELYLLRDARSQVTDPDMWVVLPRECYSCVLELTAENAATRITPLLASEIPTYSELDATRIAMNVRNHEGKPAHAMRLVDALDEAIRQTELLLARLLN